MKKLCLLLFLYYHIFICQELQQIAHVLKEHMIASNPDEIIMWQVWCKEFNERFLPFIAA